MLCKLARDAIPEVRPSFCHVLLPLLIRTKIAMLKRGGHVGNRLLHINYVHSNLLLANISFPIGLRLATEIA